MKRFTKNQGGLWHCRVVEQGLKAEGKLKPKEGMSKEEFRRKMQEDKDGLSARSREK